MVKWSMRAYLERALAAYQADKPGMGLPVIITMAGNDETVMVSLIEVHNDFILTELGGCVTTWPMGQIAVSIPASVIHAGEKTRSGVPLEKPERKKEKVDAKGSSFGPEFGPDGQLLQLHPDRAGHRTAG